MNLNGWYMCTPNGWYWWFNRHGGLIYLTLKYFTLFNLLILKATKISEWIKEFVLQVLNGIHYLTWTLVNCHKLYYEHKCKLISQFTQTHYNHVHFHYNSQNNQRITKWFSNIPHKPWCIIKLSLHLIIPQWNSTSKMGKRNFGLYFTIEVQFVYIKSRKFQLTNP